MPNRMQISIVRQDKRMKYCTCSITEQCNYCIQKKSNSTEVQRWDNFASAIQNTSCNLKTKENKR